VTIKHHYYRPTKIWYSSMPQYMAHVIA